MKIGCLLIAFVCLAGVSTSPTHAQSVLIEAESFEQHIQLRYAWQYRNYVIDAFNADKPFDQFIREQVAGDLLPAADDATSYCQMLCSESLF